MQSICVKAFRQRLIRAGFTDVSITDCYNGQYIVCATDRNFVSYRSRLTENQMNELPRKVWFDCEDVISRGTL